MANPSPGASAKVASYLSRLNPVPAFPEYTGPYKVGTVDVEIPASELESPTPAPESAAGIHTVQFRIFYPATPDSKGKRITWLPAPQRNHVSAYTKFLGVGPILAEVVSFLPRHLHYTSIPVHKNASLLEPNTSNNRWPTMIFSHGLGGNRNAYSHIVGSLASHGIVVICPEHRDGSSAVSFVRDPAAQDSFFKRSTRTEIPYRRVPHTETPDVWDSRNQQLRHRAWELGLVHEALLGIEEKVGMTNLNTSTPVSSLEQFAGKLYVHEPGSIVWAGHSFGAATIVQLLKSTYYADLPEIASMKEQLFTPRLGSRIRAQITEKNPTILLDMWCFPLLAESMRPLYRLPLPAYADVSSAPGGTGLLAVESETFYKWTAHLHATAKILSPDPSAPTVTSSAYMRPSGVRMTEPNLFYVEHSAHLNQSDFGLLFPWLTKRVFGAECPERALRLNLRAALQFLRTNGVSVARTWVGDLIDGAHDGKVLAAPGEERPNDNNTNHKDHADGIQDDKAILDRTEEGCVEAWRWIDIIGLGEAADRPKKAGEETAEREVMDEEQDMKGEIEPHLADAAPRSVQTTVDATA